MNKMQAILYQEVKNFDSMEIKSVNYPRPSAGEAVVHIKAAALNHRDVWIVQGLYAGIRVPLILGSDGSGTVYEVGDSVDTSWLGKDVVINPALGWGKNPRVQDSRFRILGLPDDGTQAEYVKIPAENLFRKPEYLSFAQAAAIPLGGLTGYRALFTQGGLGSGQTVLLTGIGGGVAGLMHKMAIAAGAKVLVTSGDDAKIQRATAQGAAGGANYRQKDWEKIITDLAGDPGVDLIVDSAGGPGFDKLISIINPGGRIVLLGATAGNPSDVNLRRVFWKQITVQGTTMGTPLDFKRMLDLFTKHRIQPLIDGPYDFTGFRMAYERMIDGVQFGKIVLLNTL